MILFDRVTKVYPRQKIEALNKISLFIKAKEFVVLVGPSGAGKSTILNLLTREERPTSGRIVVSGLDYSRLPDKDIPKIRRRLGIIFQDFKLLPNKTVYENVAFALQITGATNSEVNSVVPKVLQTVNLNGKELSMPHELSGGERQRAAIARSLVRQPKILIADEPTGNLDAKHAWDVIDLLVTINKHGTTVLLATHNQDIVKKLKKRVVLVEDGKIAKGGQKRAARRQIRRVIGGS